MVGKLLVAPTRSSFNREYEYIWIPIAPNRSLHSPLDSIRQLRSLGHPAFLRNTSRLLRARSNGGSADLIRGPLGILTETTRRVSDVCLSKLLGVQNHFWVSVQIICIWCISKYLSKNSPHVIIQRSNWDSVGALHSYHSTRPNGTPGIQTLDLRLQALNFLAPSRGDDESGHWVDDCQSSLRELGVQQKKAGQLDLLISLPVWQMEAGVKPQSPLVEHLDGRKKRQSYTIH